MSRAAELRGPPPGDRNFLSRRIDEKKRMQEAVAGHRTGLPPGLLRMFAPREPLPPHNFPAKRPPKLPYTGVAQYVQHFAEPDDAEYEPPPPETRPPEPRIFRNPELATQARVDMESKVEKDVRLRQERLLATASARQEAEKGWDPAKDPNVEGDPFKTLFVARLSYDVTERKLRREFEEWGPVKRIRLVHDRNTGKPRGYAFIEYEHKNDMKQAYKMADGRKVEDRRVLVDVERGRTVPAWRPRRLGGGKGGDARAVARPPKDLKKQFVSRLVERLLAEKERAARGGDERQREEGEREEGERREERSSERGYRDERERREPDRRDSRGDSRGADRDRLRERSRDRSSRRDYERRDERRDDYRKRDRDTERRDYDRDAKRPRERDL